MTGKVILVGAGCGSFDLITLRGREALGRCHTVIYDSLIDKRLLDFCPDAEKLCVGKRAGGGSVPQEEINSLLIEKAAEGKTVVRLKGGDPFVFGRGGEEAAELERHGIPYTVVPGISSAIAVPELAGIPVTHRGVSGSFHVITAHTADGIPDFARYAGLGGTLVFLMGLGALEKLSQGLISGGMPKDTPSAVISNGAAAEQRTVKAPLCELAKKAEGLAAPAVIVVGQTALLDFSPTFYPPLYGVNAAVAASPGTAKRLIAKLTALGAYAYRAGGSELRENTGAVPKDFGGYTHIALTSPNGAEIFLKRLRERRTDLRSLSGITFAAIGKGTAAVLENAGIYPELVPNEYSTRALAGLLCAALKDTDRLLIMRSADGSRELTKILDEHGIRYDDTAIYKPIYRAAERIENGFALFASAGAVMGFFENGGTLSDGAIAAAIGPQTAAELKRHGIKECIVPRESTVDSMTEAILEVITCRDSDD